MPAELLAAAGEGLGQGVTKEGATSGVGAAGGGGRVGVVVGGGATAAGLADTLRAVVGEYQDTFVRCVRVVWGHTYAL